MTQRARLTVMFVGMVTAVGCALAAASSFGVASTMTLTAMVTASVGIARLQRERRLRREIEQERAAMLKHTQDVLAQADRANRVKEDFLSVLSHELRTPLNAILGWTQLLQRTHLPESMNQQAIETIQRNVRAQAALVRNLLDASSAASGNLRLDAHPMYLSEAVNATIETFTPAAAAKGLRLTRRVDASSDLVYGDRLRLQQAVAQLLSNAVKFTPTGGRVDVVLRRVGSRLEITVSDTGTGIPSDLVPHVFDRFVQSDCTATRAFDGLGLGLSIARDVIELHGGTVGATSAGEGRGAKFTVRLPVYLAAAPRAAIAAGAARTRQAGAAKSRF